MTESGITLIKKVKKIVLKISCLSYAVIFPGVSEENI